MSSISSPSFSVRRHNIALAVRRQSWRRTPDLQSILWLNLARYQSLFWGGPTPSARPCTRVWSLLSLFNPWGLSEALRGSQSLSVTFSSFRSFTLARLNRSRAFRRSFAFSSEVHFRFSNVSMCWWVSSIETTRQRRLTVARLTHAASPPASNCNDCFSSLPLHSAISLSSISSSRSNNFRFLFHKSLVIFSKSIAPVRWSWLSDFRQIPTMATFLHSLEKMLLYFHHLAFPSITDLQIAALGRSTVQIKKCKWCLFPCHRLLQKLFFSVRFFQLRNACF